MQQTAEFGFVASKLSLPPFEKKLFGPNTGEVPSSQHLKHDPYNLINAKCVTARVLQLLVGAQIFVGLGFYF